MVKRVIAIVVTLMSFVALPLFSFAASDATIDVSQPKSAYTYSLSDGQGNNYDHMEITWSGGWNYPSISVTSTRTLTFTADCGYTLQPGYTYDFQWDCYVSGSIWPVTLDLGFYTINSAGTQTSNKINLTSSPSGGGAGYYTYHCYITPSEPVTYSLTWRIKRISGSAATGQCQYRLPYILCTNDTIANANQNRDEIIANQNQAKDEIIANQDKNTDKFINGDGTPLAPDANKDLDNAGEQMGNLENDALGGKSDEEIANDVNSALSFDVGSLDSNAQAGVSGFFDGLLIVFGVDYQSLLVLSLSLGLAAFIIGRKYKAG